MPASQIIGFSTMDPGGFGPNIQRSICPANTLNGNTLANVEFSEMGVREAGVFDKAQGRITSNTFDGSTTFTLRLSRTDTSIVLTVGAAQTGTFEDTTNTATAAAADEMEWRLDTRGSTVGLMNGKILALRFTPTDTAATVAWAYCGGSGGGTSSDSTVRYSPTTSTMGVSATERDASSKIHGIFTSKSLYFEVASNARITDTVIRTRINNANGNQTVTVGSTQTGVFEDSTHTDTLAVEDTYNYSWTTLTGGGTINSRACSTNIVSAARQWVHFGGNVGGVAFAAGGLTSYASLSGNFAQNTDIEADTQVKTFAQTLSKLSAGVSANTATGTTTVRTRINGANGTNCLAVGTLQTGVFEDLTDNDPIADNDLVNLMFVPSTGSGTATFRMFSILARTGAGPSGGAIVFNMQVG